MGFASRVAEFDEFAPEAQKVIDTVKVERLVRTAQALFTQPRRRLILRS